jgi:hypothetical protein
MNLTGKVDDLTSIKQWRANTVERVGGGDEYALAQVHRHVDVVIRESMILFRVQHLEERGRWVSMEVVVTNLMQTVS